MAKHYEVSLISLKEMIQKHQRDTPVLIAIDGHSAAGKSTLARKLAEALGNSEIISTDDFYRPMPNDLRFSLDAQEGYESYYDWQRLRQEVLKPLSNGKSANFRKYDWQKNVLGKENLVLPKDFVIVEGCYSARPELSDYYDVIVLVDTSPDERMKRQKQRNDATKDWLTRWDAAEVYYIGTTNLRERAHFVFQGE